MGVIISYNITYSRSKSQVASTIGGGDHIGRDTLGGHTEVCLLQRYIKIFQKIPYKHGEDEMPWFTQERSNNSEINVDRRCIIKSAR